MSKVQIYTQNTSASSMYPSIFWIICWYTKSLYYRKYPLTTKTWHQTNTVILFGRKMNRLPTICISKQDAQGFTIGISRLHTYAHFFPIIFQSFQNFLILIILYCLKTYWYIFDLYLFVVGRNRFFTADICFKETLFFKYFSLPQITCKFRLSVRK